MLARSQGLRRRPQREGRAGLPHPSQGVFRASAKRSEGRTGLGRGPRVGGRYPTRPPNQAAVYTPVPSLGVDACGSSRSSAHRSPPTGLEHGDLAVEKLSHVGLNQGTEATGIESFLAVPGAVDAVEVGDRAGLQVGSLGV